MGSTSSPQVGSQTFGRPRSIEVVPSSPIGVQILPGSHLPISLNQHTGPSSHDNSACESSDHEHTLHKQP